MTITVSLAHTLKLASALRALSDQPLAGRAAFRVGRLVRAVSDAAETYDTARRGLLRTHAQLDDTGAPVTIESGGQSRVSLKDAQAFESEHRALLAETVDLPALSLPLEWLTTSATGEPLAVPATVLAALQEWIVVEEGDEAAE